MSLIKLDIAVSIILIAVVVALLPTSPFQYFLNNMDSLGGLVDLSYVNWFIPFDSMLAVGQAWLLCISVYYAYEYVMRFIKLIS